MIRSFSARVGSNGSSTASAEMAAIISDFNAFGAHLEGMSAEILKQALEPTFQMTQNEVPVATGELKASGYLEITGKGTVEMGYGKGDKPHYAGVVHEDTTVFHAAPTKAKFLQGPLEQDYYAILQRVAQGTRQAAGMRG